MHFTQTQEKKKKKKKRTWREGNELTEDILVIETSRVLSAVFRPSHLIAIYIKVTPYRRIAIE